MRICPLWTVVGRLLVVPAEGVGKEIRQQGDGVFLDLYDLYDYRVYYRQYGVVSRKSEFLYARSNDLRYKVETENK